MTGAPIARESGQSRRTPEGVARVVRRTAYPVASLALLLLIWEAVARGFDMNPVILPAPSRVFPNLFATLPVLAGESRVTIVETILGFGLAVVIGCPIGVAIVFSERTRAAVYPLLVASQMVPKVALAPLFLVWFGVGITSKLAVAFLVAFFPIVIATALGLDAVDPDMVRLFRSMGASRGRTFFKLRLPTAMPSIFAGLKVAMTLAVVGALVGEFVAANHGLGYYILFQNGQLNTTAVNAAIIVVTVIGVILYFAVELAERLLSPRSARRKDVIGTTM